MDGQFVTWGSYEGVDGFGAGGAQHLDELSKALTVGSDRDPPGSVVAGDGFALRTESLDATLRNTTFKMEHIRLWKAIYKAAAFNTVEEYNQLQGYGSNDDAAFMGEIDLPEEQDSTYERKFAVIKYMGVVGRVSHVSTLVRAAHGKILAQETMNKTMDLLMKVERALYYGDSNLQALQFDGFEKLILSNSPAGNIHDNRGLPLTEDGLTDACLTVQDAPNYGMPTHMHCTPKVKADLIKQFFPRSRYDLLQKTSDGMIGLDIRGISTPAGDLLFEPNTFITDGGSPQAARGDTSKRPASPTISTGDSTPPAALSQFAAADAGSYFYKIAAVNRYGRSAAVAVDASAIAVAAGDEMTFGVTPGSAVSVDYYILYRSKVGGAEGSERQILRIKNTAGAGELTVHDYNASLPYSSSVFIFQQNEENMTWRQLAPMTRIPLAVIDTSIRWAQVLYGVPVLHTPGKNFLFTNVGRAQGYVGQP